VEAIEIGSLRRESCPSFAPTPGQSSTGTQPPNLTRREEEARHRQEEHDRRGAREQKPLTEKVKEMVGAR
jgi:hypothetical protein